MTKTTKGIQVEIEKLRQDAEVDERRARIRLEEDIKQAEANMKKEIEAESTYLRNRLTIEICQLRTGVEAEVDRINKERYKDIGTVEEVLAKQTSGERVADEQSRTQFEKELEKERETFARECNQRRARFDAHRQMLFEENNRDRDRIEFLKQQVVALVNAPGVTRISDESILETRHQIKFTRNAIRSGPSYALYKSRVQNQQVACRVTVFNKVPIEIRRELNSTAKCIRFLCEKPLNERFVKLYGLYATEDKMYSFVEEFNPVNLAYQVHHGKVTTELVAKWSRQLTEALQFMHTYAIGHLNVKCENVIFDNDQNVKIVGLMRAFLYFCLDQERFIRAPKVKQVVYNDHLPPECFEQDFNPPPADVWSLGFVMYEMATRHNPLRPEHKTPPKRKPLNTYPNASSLFQFSKVVDTSLRSLLERMLAFTIGSRPKFDAILKSDYFTGAGDGINDSPAKKDKNDAESSEVEE